MKDLIEKRKKIKNKKPKFTMQDSHKLKRLKKKWRKPRGIDSKIRLGLKGYRKEVEVGYGSPKKVRGLDKTGLEPVLVNSKKDIEAIDKQKQGAIFSGKLGKKKKTDLIKKAQEKGIRILNIKADEYLKKVSEELKQKKEKKAKIQKDKENRKAKKKAAEKDKLAEKVDEEEKKSTEKKEKDKVLTRKEA